MVEAENKRLVDQMNGDIGGAKQRVPQLVNTGSSTHVSQSAPRSSDNQKQQAAPAPTSWHRSYQQHLTKNQVKAAQPKTTKAWT